jgi:hypothetical protein
MLKCFHSIVNALRSQLETCAHYLIGLSKQGAELINNFNADLNSSTALYYSRCHQYPTFCKNCRNGLLPICLVAPICNCKFCHSSAVGINLKSAGNLFELSDTFCLNIFRSVSNNAATSSSSIILSPLNLKTLSIMISDASSAFILLLSILKHDWYLGKLIKSPVHGSK